MENKIKELYDRLIQEYSDEKLKSISSKIIASYQNKEYNDLVAYAMRLGIEGYGEHANIGKIFVKVIKAYHPDKLNVILSSIENAYKNSNIDLLLNYACQIGIEDYAVEAPVKSEYDTELEINKEYEHDEEDLNEQVEVKEFEEADFYFGEKKQYEGEVFGFRESFAGNAGGSGLKFEQNSSILILEMSGNALKDISSIGKYKKLTVLDLSNNEISNIAPLAGLEDLISLDLAANSISDITHLAHLQKLIYLNLSKNNLSNISTLLKLKSLKTVDLSGNQSPDRDTIDRLKKKGVNVYL